MFGSVVSVGVSGASTLDCPPAALEGGWNASMECLQSTHHVRLPNDVP